MRSYFVNEVYPLTFQLLKRAMLMVGCILSVVQLSWSQHQFQHFWSPSDTLNKTRIWMATSATAVTYGSMGSGLYYLWYKNHDQTSFHLFNDWNEWQNMDKVGHATSAYMQAMAGYKVAKWTGANENHAIWSGVALGTVAQLGIELMDGYSTKWGFSIPDLSFNMLGVGLFAFQQKYWGEQRITMKISNLPKRYPQYPLFPTGSHFSDYTIQQRANNLFGDNYLQTFLKDYNAQAIWLSFNVDAWLAEDNRWPNWLNIALGYGIENTFGGFDNEFTHDGKTYQVPVDDFPRYSQIFLALDVDFWRIRTKHAWLNTLLDIANGFHLPSPAIELNTLGEIHFHLFM